MDFLRMGIEIIVVFVQILHMDRRHSARDSAQEGARLVLAEIDISVLTYESQNIAQRILDLFRNQQITSEQFIQQRSDLLDLDNVIDGGWWQALWHRRVRSSARVLNHDHAACFFYFDGADRAIIT